MGFETTKFGDGSAAGSGNVVTTVHNHFGRRLSKGTVGVYDTDGIMKELSVEIDGDMLGKAAWPLLAPKLPKGAKIRQVLLVITEAFVLGGTTPAIKIGTATTEATNGVSITEAQAEALGTVDLTGTLAGTWANPLAAATTVGIALAGTSPTTTTAGRGRVVIRYDNITAK